MTDKLCVVTGTTSGIGLGLVPQLLEDGWQVLGIARRTAQVTHDSYSHVSLDLTDAAAVEAYFAGPFLQEVPIAQASRVGLVNNAATVEPITPTWKAGLAEYAQAALLNLVIPMWLMGFFVHHAPQAALRIINITSGAATVPLPGWSAYCATKAGLRQAGIVLGEEIAAFPEGSGVHPNLALVSYSPGIVDTPMQGVIRGHTAEQFPQVGRFVGMHEAGKLGDVETPGADIVALLNRDDLPTASEAQVTGYAERVQGIRED